MPKKTVAIIVGIVILIFGAAITYAAINSSKNNSGSETEQNSTSPAGEPDSGSDTDTPATPPPSDPDAPVSSQPGRFIDYSEAELNQASGRKLLFFHAPWCPQCRALEADINNKGVPNDMTIFKVDYDTSQDLRQKYDVTIQTTIVEVDSNGNIINKIVAYDEPTLAFVLNNL